jgi:hypothetical protein
MNAALKSSLLLTALSVVSCGVAAARSPVGPCNSGQPEPKLGALHHSQEDIVALAWGTLGLSKSDWRLDRVCIEAAPVPTWVVSFFGRNNTPPTFHWTISIEDASGKVETLLGH